MFFEFQRARPSVLPARILAFLILGSILTGASGDASAQIDPFKEDFTPDAIEQRREQRQVEREQLAQQVQSAYRLTTPFVSAPIIDSTRAAIARYEQAELAGGWAPIPDAATLRLDDVSEIVAGLRQRLELTSGQPIPAETAPSRFDAALQHAVGRYQLSNGLAVTGFVDQPTRRALNVPVSTRLRQLRENLARLEKLAAQTGSGRYVLVNVPAFTLQGVDQGQLMIDSRVVVGRPSRQTPDMSARIVELNFHPTWRVPQSVVKRDLVPKLSIDPGLLEREHFTIHPARGGKALDASAIDWTAPKSASYRFQQKPGPWNALGALRMNMPNRDAIFLHDTPHKALYESRTPAYTAGCVRVERVADIATWLAEGVKGWDAARIGEVLAAGEPRSVKLRKAVPVHLVYITSWATPDGLVHFRPDIYGRDGAEDKGEIEQVAGADSLAP
jgi:murein L,D-transpeptidase YcbB/YkuD